MIDTSESYLTPMEALSYTKQVTMKISPSGERLSCVWLTDNPEYFQKLISYFQEYHMALYSRRYDDNINPSHLLQILNHRHFTESLELSGGLKYLLDTINNPDDNGIGDIQKCLAKGIALRYFYVIMLEKDTALSHYKEFAYFVFTLLAEMNELDIPDSFYTARDLLRLIEDIEKGMDFLDILKKYLL